MKFLDWLSEHYEDYPDVHLSEYEGELFIIVDSWDTVNEWTEKFSEWESEIDYNWGFYDEWDLCSNCYNVIRTSPDSYSWQPDYQLNDWGIFCKDCIDGDEYIEEHINANKLLNRDLVNPEDHGFDMIEDLCFENGFHHGQNADPRAIIKALNKHSIDCLFTGYTGQFDVNFYVWVKQELLTIAKNILENSDTDLPYDIATEMSKVLQGKHSDHINRVESVISQQDFIDGNIPKVGGNTVHSITVK